MSILRVSVFSFVFRQVVHGFYRELSAGLRKANLSTEDEGGEAGGCNVEKGKRWGGMKQKTNVGT